MLISWIEHKYLYFSLILKQKAPGKHYFVSELILSSFTLVSILPFFRDTLMEIVLIKCFGQQELMETNRGMAQSDSVLETLVHCQLMTLLPEFIENIRLDDIFQCSNLHFKSTSIPISTSFSPFTEKVMFLLTCIVNTSPWCYARIPPMSSRPSNFIPSSSLFFSHFSNTPLLPTIFTFSL